MAALDRAGLLAPRAFPVERVPVPERGEDAFVFIKALNAGEFARLSGIVQGGQRAASQWHGLVLSLSLCDEGGAPLLQFPADADALMQTYSFETLQRLYEVAARLSGLNREAAEEAEKNSQPIPPGASPSG